MSLVKIKIDNNEKTPNIISRKQILDKDLIRYIDIREI
jgi:hypothetical protein